MYNTDTIENEKKKFKQQLNDVNNKYDIFETTVRSKLAENIKVFQFNKILIIYF